MPHRLTSSFLLDSDQRRDASVTRLRRLVLGACLVVAIAPPLLLFAHLRSYESASINTEAEIHARLITDFINHAPDLWQFQTDKLETLLAERSRFGNVTETRRVLSMEGQLIAASESPLLAPLIVTQADLLDAGHPVGRLEIQRSLRPALNQCLAAAALSSSAALLLFLLVSTMPLRALQRALSDFQSERDKALLTLRSIGDAVVTTDAQQRVEYLNPVAESLSGWRSDEARGRPVTEVLQLIRVDSREPVPNPVAQCLAKLEIVELASNTMLLRRGDGAEFHIEDSAAPIIGRAGVVMGAILVFHDVSERIHAQQQLQHAAFHDALTGLPNRDLFRNRLIKAMDDARRNQRALAVMFMDLDRFKAINDSLGHSAGDELLVLAAKRIRHCVRESDLVCRLGGDEFTALLRNVDSVPSAMTVAGKILDAMARPFQIGCEQVRVSGSIGIALFPDHGDSVEELLKNADMAMYQAKDQGRNNAQVYAAEMNAKAGERLRMAFALQLALERDEYRIVYQPKLSLATGEVVAVEALLRWHSPDMGTISPVEFVPQLEESGGIVDVGRWVLKNAMLQAKRWHEAGRPLTVAVNVSAVQFVQPGLVSDIAQMLHDTGLPPDRIQIELTESLLMDDLQHTHFVIGELTRLGVLLSLDDFGTGYSSLGYLRRFAVHELKIDRSFVHEIDSSPVAARIVKTVVDLGQALGMSVTAEGVENELQATRLREMGCDQLQGYWLARPMPIDELDAWLAAHPSVHPCARSKQAAGANTTPPARSTTHASPPRPAR